MRLSLLTSLSSLYLSSFPLFYFLSIFSPFSFFSTPLLLPSSSLLFFPPPSSLPSPLYTSPPFFFFPPSPFSLLLLSPSSLSRSEFKMGSQVEDQQVSCLWQGSYLLSVSVSGFINYLDVNNPDKPLRILRVSSWSYSQAPLCVCARAWEWG